MHLKNMFSFFFLSFTNILQASAERLFQKELKNRQIHLNTMFFISKILFTNIRSQYHNCTNLNNKSPHQILTDLL